MADPWHAVKQEIEVTLEEVARLQASNAQQAKISSLLNSVELDLNDLKSTIDIVETQRERFQNVTDEELESRRAFLRVTAALIETSRDAGQGRASSGGGGGGGSSCVAVDIAEPENEREGLLGGSASTRAKPKGRRQMAAEAANADALAQHGQQQQLQLEEQEEVLDDLHGAVRRLKSMGSQMNEELTTQNRMIGALEEQMDHVSGTMGMLRSKMAQMARSEDRGKYCAILLLTLLLVVLTSLVLGS